MRSSLFRDCIQRRLTVTDQLGALIIYLFIKYYIPLHVSSIKCPSSGGYSCIHAAYGTVTLYESSWWPVGTQLTLCTDRPPRTVTVPYAACIQLYPPEDEHLMLETCKGI